MMRDDTCRKAFSAPLSLRCAVRWHERALGLLVGARLQAGEGLLIANCSAVHTFGMRYAIGVFFLDARDRVTGARGVLDPGSCAWERRAVSVVETRAVAPADLARAIGCVEESVRLLRAAKRIQPGVE